MDRLRVALIGPGFIAQRHLEVLGSEPGAELVGIVSRSLAKAETAAHRYGGRSRTRRWAIFTLVSAVGMLAAAAVTFARLHAPVGA